MYNQVIKKSIMKQLKLRNNILVHFRIITVPTSEENPYPGF